MNFDNIHLFELINAGAQPAWTTLALARVVAQWLVLAVPVAWLVLWVRGGRAVRQDLVHVAVAAALALGIAQLVGLALRTPRPFALHLGHQYLAHADDPGLPSDMSRCCGAWPSRPWARRAVPGWCSRCWGRGC